MTWQTIDRAPLSQIQTVGSGKGARPGLVKTWIWSYREEDGHMTLSYWIPTEERWAGYTKKFPPTHWHPYMRPDPPTPAELAAAKPQDGRRAPRGSGGDNPPPAPKKAPPRARRRG